MAAAAVLGRLTDENLLLLLVSQGLQDPWDPLQYPRKHPALFVLYGPLPGPQQLENLLENQLGSQLPWTCFATGLGWGWESRLLVTPAAGTVVNLSAPVRPCL